MNKDYRDGYSFPKSVLFDLERMKNLFNKKWFFVGTRGDVPSKGSFSIFNYLMTHILFFMDLMKKIKILKIVKNR